MPVMINYDSVDDYIAAQPQNLRPALKELRESIKAAAPKATEVISYCMPAFRQDGIVVWYAATKKHFALYPKAAAIAAFKKELETYSTAKGTIRFPIDKPLPFDLIKAIVAFRLEENKQLASVKAAQKRKPSAKRNAGA